ncbi:MAG: RecX family transcriptional regulator [bacterium]|nr:RecX family transcriptional regulator [bacterium]
MTTITKMNYMETKVRVEFDNGERFDLPFEIVSRFRLSTGTEINEETYTRLFEEWTRFRCKRKALDYLAIRNRSTSEMKLALKKKKFPSDMIDETVEELVTAGYINDMDFALRFVKSKIKSKSIGENLLRKELFQKGLSREIIDQALEEGGARDIDFERLYETAQKKYKSSEGKKNRMQKLSYFLYQRGFKSETVNQILKRLKSEEEEEKEEEEEWGNSV